MSGRTVLIVDGYNVLRAASGPYAALADEDLDIARSRLVTDVASALDPGTSATVVFDGGGNPASDGAEHEVAGVTVVFSPFGVTADSVIEQRAARHRADGDSVTVVTSDAQTQWAVLGARVVRLSAAGFARDLAVEHAERAEANPVGRRRTTLAERVDPGISERLAEWARGGASPGD